MTNNGSLSLNHGSLTGWLPTLQVSMRWVYEQGVSVVVKSFNKERMKQNLEIFDWCLTEEDSNKISQLPQRKGVLFVDMIGPEDSMRELDEEL